MKQKVSPGADAGREAISLGLAALKSGDPGSARDWFERAHRLAPDSPHVAVMLASATLAADPMKSLQILEKLPASRLSRDARMLRITALQELGLAVQADAELGAFLTGFVIPSGGHFHELADAVARAAGHQGWAGVAASGQVICSAPVYAIALDGQNVPLVPGRNATLPENWRHGGILSILSPDGPVLPASIDLAVLGRTEGAAWVEAGGRITGWALSPADPELSPRIELVTESGHLVATAIANDATAIGAEGEPGPAHGFRLSLPAPQQAELLWLRGPDGRKLGNPLFAWSEADKQRDALHGSGDHWRALPAAIAGLVPLCAETPSQKPVCAVLLTPGVIGDGPALLREMVAQLDAGDRLVVAGDARDAAIWREAIAGLGQDDRVSWATLERPPSLSAAVGVVESLSWSGDLLILAGGARLLAGGLRGLRQAIYLRPAHGTASPLIYRPGEALTADADLLAKAVADHPPHLLPTPVCSAHCVLIRHDCLAALTPALVPLVLPGGGEAVDLALRITHLGWRHMITSAAAAIADSPAMAVAQRAETAAVLAMLHPGGLDLIEKWPGRDTLASAHAALEAEIWRRQQTSAAVLLITHDSGGGIARFVAERVAALRAEGKRAIVLRPRDGFALSDGMADTHPNLHFSQLSPLVALLRGDHIAAVEVHHAIDFDPAVLSLPGLLRVPFDIYLHDYAVFCPRITLLGGDGFFCGEPEDRRDCEHCIADHGAQFEFTGTVEEHRARHGQFLRMARRVIAPTQDAASRLLRFVPKLNLLVRTWEDDRAFAAIGTSPHRQKTGPLAVAIVGGIGKDKGYDVLLACARDAERRQLALRFVLIGQSVDDGRLLATGRVFVTGYFEEGDAPALLEQFSPDLGFVPSVWPETWCYSLSALLQAGLHVTCFDLGGPAERLRNLDRGCMLPLRTSAAAINDHFLKLAANPGERN